MPDQSAYEVFNDVAEYIDERKAFSGNLGFRAISSNESKIERAFNSLSKILIEIDLRKVVSFDSFLSHEEYYLFKNLKITEDYSCNTFYDDRLPTQAPVTEGFVNFPEWVNYCIAKKFIGLDVINKLCERTERMCFSNEEFIRNNRHLFKRI